MPNSSSPHTSSLHKHLPSLFRALHALSSGAQHLARSIFATWKQLTPAQFERALPWLLFLYAALWLGLLLRLYPSSPLDNVEQFVWAQSLEWGYYKHPPLPTWMLAVATSIFGVHDWVAYVLGAFVTLGSLVALYRFLKPWFGIEVALVWLLAAVCVSYYSSRIHYFNHNTVLTACVVGIACMGYEALHSRSLRAWAWVGVWTGFALLSKYQVVIALAALAAVALQQRAWRDALHRKGVALSVLIAALIITPHVVWLVRHDFAPFRYAEESSLGAGLPWLLRTGETLNWLLDQLGRVAPGLIVFGIAAWGVSRWLRTNGMLQVVHPHPRLSMLQRTWLWAFGPGTFLLMALICLVTAAQPQPQWGTAFALFVPAWFLGDRAWKFLQLPVLRYALIGFVVVQALLLYNMINMSRSSTDAVARSRFQNFESQLAVAGVREQLRGFGLPMPRYLVGTSFIAGNLKLMWPHAAQVLIQGDFKKSPWIDQAQFEACGGLAIWPVEESPEWVIGQPLTDRLSFRGSFRLKAEDGPRSALNWGWIEPTKGVCAKQ
jgi:Dolichyl-phosphate-mannose-protein mannosyltransferase